MTSPSKIPLTEEVQERSDAPIEPPLEDLDPPSPKKNKRRKWSWAYLKAKWAKTVARMHPPVNRVLIKVAVASAKRPIATLVIASIFSIAMLGAGFFTNFYLELDEDILWSPQDSRSMAHSQWLESESGYPLPRRYLAYHVHAQGQNVLTVEGVRRVFTTLDLIQTSVDAQDYSELCTPDCDILSVTRFWNHSMALFEAQVQTDEDVRRTLSQLTYPDGSRVDTLSLMGNPVYEEVEEEELQQQQQQGALPQTGLNSSHVPSSALAVPRMLQSASIFLSYLTYEAAGEDRELFAESLEAKFVDVLWEASDDWKSGDDDYRLSFISERSFADEFTRSIFNDIPLIIAIFFIMSTFTACVFFKRDPVQSRMMLGISAVVTIVLSLMTGYGLMFLCGVPLTSISQLLPFIMFGIGLDDAFIITGSFYRTSPSDDILDRVEETINDVGVSIALTTVTSAVAFGLGCLSSIPAVYWLCLYAFPTILIDFFYQVSVFIAFVVLDERRVAARRRDMVPCLIVPEPEPMVPPLAHQDGKNEEEEDGQTLGTSPSASSQESLSLSPVVNVTASAEENTSPLPSPTDLPPRRAPDENNKHVAVATMSALARGEGWGGVPNKSATRSTGSFGYMKPGKHRGGRKKRRYDPVEEEPVAEPDSWYASVMTSLESFSMQDAFDLLMPSETSSSDQNLPKQPEEKKRELRLPTSVHAEGGAAEMIETELGYVQRDDNKIPPEEQERSRKAPGQAEDADPSMVDRFMIWYASKLLKPWVRYLVIAGALALAGVMGYSTSQLTQEFDLTEVLPADSYITDYLDSYEDYTSQGIIQIQVNFRFVDQSLPSVQNQMTEYVEGMVNLTQVSDPPAFFWLSDFNKFVSSDPAVQTLPFNEQLLLFRTNPLYSDLYFADLAVNDVGNLTASRVWMFMTNVDANDIKAQINALHDQRAVSAEQPVNEGRSNWAFFAYGDQFPIFEFFAVAVDELIFATIVGVASVTGLGLFFIPHWSAAFFIFPTMIVLYIDLLGFIQFCGVHINAVSYVTCAMSIGLLVDFIVHVLFRYFELQGDRISRTKEMMRTMGSSILVGGLTTFIGVLPVAFASSPIFFTVFATFLGMILLGLSHGLIVMPALLATFGPEDDVPIEKSRRAKELRASFAADIFGLLRRSSLMLSRRFSSRGYNGKTMQELVESMNLEDLDLSSDDEEDQEDEVPIEEGLPEDENANLEVRRLASF